MKQKLKNTLAFLLPIQIILIKIIATQPDFIEKYYSTGIYPYVAKTSRFLLGWIPFSIGDLLYSLLILFLLKWICKNFKNFHKKPRTTFINLLSFISVIVFCFYFLWGLNYYRHPLHKTLALETEYTTEELILVTKKFIEKANTIHNNINDNDTIKVTVPYSKKEIFKKTLNGYKHLNTIFPELKLEQKSIKKSIYSLPLTYMGYGGYLNPFTQESQVNYKIPKHLFPNVSCHEQAHQLGFAAENEANFIGSLAAMSNDDIYFQYSGTTFALRSCLREIYRRDKTTYDALIKNINKGIIKNYKESRDFWLAYENPLEPIFKNSFDAFLKANNQINGIESYSYVVALLVNYDKKNN